MTDSDNATLTGSRTPEEVLDGFINVQCKEGNWNSNPYQHGVANGLLLAKSIITNDDDIEFLETPEEWVAADQIDFVNEISNLKNLLQECRKRFKLYEMDADMTPPDHHIDFMKRVKAALGG